MKFGVERISGPNVQDPYNVADLRQELEDFMRGVAPSRKLTIVDSVQDLINSRDRGLQEIGAELALDGNELAYGVARGGRAVLVANRIRRGYGRAKFMHEVGVHLGLKKLLPDAEFESLVGQIVRWSDGPADTVEGQLARKALARVPESTPDADVKEEVLAYFIEEAVQANINPAAVGADAVQGPLRTWFRNLWAAFKAATRKLGINPESLTPQDYVNLAYGAARLEIAGTWHGTAADFRRFDHRYMGTGEGAQAYGWGTYLAQRVGIAKGYWSADVRRKSRVSPPSNLNGEERALFNKLRAEGVTSVDNWYALSEGGLGDGATENDVRVFDGLYRKLQESGRVTKPEGAVMRVDTAVPENEMLDWDTPLSQQPNVLPKIEAALPQDLREAMEEEANANLAEMTGDDFYRALEFLEKRDGLVSDQFETADYNARLANARPRRVVSAYIDEKLGINGLKFLDADSRDRQANEDRLRVVERNIEAIKSGNARRYNVQGEDFLAAYERRAEGLRAKLNSPETRNVVIFDDRNMVRAGSAVAADRQRMKFGVDGEVEPPPELVTREDGRVEDLVVNGKVVRSFEIVPVGLWNAFKGDARDNLLNNEGPRNKRTEALDALEAARRDYMERAPINGVERNVLQRLERGDINLLRSENFIDETQLRPSIAVLWQHGAFETDTVLDVRNPDEAARKFGVRLDADGRKNLERFAPDWMLGKADRPAQPEFEPSAPSANAPRKRETRLKFGKEARQGVNEATTRQATAERVKNLNRIPAPARGAANSIVSALRDIGARALDRAVFTSDLTRRAVDLGMQSANRLQRSLAARDFMAREESRAVESILNGYVDLTETERGAGEGSVNRFLFDSTRTGKWGYGDRADAEMAARFDAFSPAAKKFIQDIFAHGDSMLQRKKDIVLDATRSEFDAQIANAKTNKEKAELRKAKQLAMKRYETLFRIREGRPYAPIKRTGNYVVIAKSQEYMDAEAREDNARIKELESNGDHYHVSFTDGKRTGQELRRQLEEQGVFADVQLAERDQATDELFSNESALQQLAKLRSNVDARVKGGEKEAGKMLSIINQMYLEALAEGSARKSEMRRRGVDAEVDMIASFAHQGNADANFLASLQYNDQVSDALNAMRKEAKTGDRTRKSEVLNELVRRYSDSLDVPDNPMINKLLRVSSVYFLASSPAYYLQNLTQPFMMSVPAMAGEHNYAKVNNELYKAYTELGPVMRSAKFFSQQFDYKEVPADVRGAINELVNRGRIDIGMDTELGEFQIDGSNKLGAKWNQVDKGLRMMVQKGEAVNRLSTAMAAYRLAMSKEGATPEQAIDYADRILLETHGDYSRYNAPRFFNHPVGRVALQFRKFQLIQLSWYAKLIRQIPDPVQRGAALRSLAFGVAHTGVLAGAMGLPGYAAAAWALGMIFGEEDEPFDLTDSIRKMIGDKEVADVVLRGLPTLGGGDWSGKIGAGNMLSVMPFSNADITTRSGFYEALGTLAGGASGGMVVRGVDGLGLLANGDYMKGFELLLPKGLGDVIKAYRLGTDGATRRNGDVILPADELNALEMAWQAIGIPPAQMSAMYEKQERVRSTERRFRERTTRIKNDYTKAMRERDTAAAAEARQAWVNLQAARVKVGLKRQPLSELIRAPREQAQRERETAGGVQFRRGTERMVEDIVER
jgi:hypothetical protein